MSYTNVVILCKLSIHNESKKEYISFSLLDGATCLECLVEVVSDSKMMTNSSKSFMFQRNGNYHLASKRKEDKCHLCKKKEVF
jgi:hypothetical protein